LVCRLPLRRQASSCHSSALQAGLSSNDGHGRIYQLPEGFTIPVRRSLTEPILLGGVPRTAAILNGTLAAALGLGLQLWLLGIIYYVCAHTLCVFFASLSVTSNIRVISRDESQ